MAAMVDAAAGEFGGLDVYVHCPSGGFEPRDPADVDEALWDAALDSTAKGFMFAAQAAHRVMAAAGGGVIVAITDVAGLQPWAKFAPHGAAKAAQIHLVKMPRPRVGPRRGSRVRRRTGAGADARGHCREPRRDGARPARQPGRRGAGAALCIEADFVTGQNIVVDGGRLLRP